MPALSPSISYNSIDDAGVKEDHQQQQQSSSPRTPKEILLDMIESVEREELKQAMKVEIKRIYANHDRLISMLQARSEVMEQENEEYKSLAADHQRRYEKAVREMQFFRKKYEKAMEINKQYVNAAVHQHQMQSSTSSPTPPLPTSVAANTASSTSNANSASNGSSNGSSNGTSNGSSNGISNGSSNGSSAAVNGSSSTTSLQQQQQQQQQVRPRSLSIDSTSSAGDQHHLPHHPGKGGNPQTYPLTPTSPQPSVLPNENSTNSFGVYDQPTPLHENNGNGSNSGSSNHHRQKATMPSRSSSTSTNNSTNGLAHWNLASTQMQEKQPSISSTDAAAAAAGSTSTTIPRLRQNSTTASVHSSHSSNTDTSSTNSKEKSPKKKQSWQLLQQNPSIASTVGPSSIISAPSLALSTSSSSTTNPKDYNPNANVNSVPMTPVRSSTATNGYTGASLIQQRRVDPLIFGGSDGLWETISKSKGSDATVEKIISNFLRRGGSPNTAKQSSSINAVKYGYGMIHALVVTKAPGALDLVLQQGANPNAFTLSAIEDDKMTPCYLAASVGWLAGLQKLVQAGGDLLTARGGGAKNKTALHAAAEHCHAAVVEYIVGVTQGRLNSEVDSLGATVLHYACASGHTDLVSFLARSCEIPVDQADYRGEWPLHWAARHGRLEVVTLLVERCGCDCNTYVPRRVGTALDLARAGGHRRLVDYLKGLGAMTSKKMEKRREEEMAKEVPKHLENTLARNGFFGGDDEF